MHKAFLSQHLHMEIVFPIPLAPLFPSPPIPFPRCCFSRCLRDMSVDLRGTSTYWYYMSRLSLPSSETQFLCSFTSLPFHSSLSLPVTLPLLFLPPFLLHLLPLYIHPFPFCTFFLSPFFTYISQSLFEWRSAVVVCCCRLLL